MSVLVPGQLTTLTIEKPAAGGRMIARADGQIVLVSGAIPGERITARIERVGKGVAYAETTSVDEPSSDRRETCPDPLCGGCLYAHIAYGRQLELKGLVIADAFARIGRMPLPVAPRVAVSSSDHGYRMRARLHVRQSNTTESVRAGFFREGTHDICDARATRQLLPATHDAIDRVVAALRSLGTTAVDDLEVSENIDASQRAIHLRLVSPVDPRSLAAVAGLEGVTGLTIGRAGAALVGGDPYVTDRLSIDGHPITLRRHVLAFFQGNRYVLADLVAHVMRPIAQGSTVLDLYAGVGLFSMAAAIARGATVVAVEGDRVAARDLEYNARSANGGVEALHQAVETLSDAARRRPDLVIVDPPRTGMSHAALERVVATGAPRLTYVSCDVATLARDARKLADAGYAVETVDAFDLFPNTPHVETVVMFIKA